MLKNRIERVIKSGMTNMSGVLLPAMTTDLETVLDALDLVAKRWQAVDGADSRIVPTPRYDFWVTAGDVTRKELAALSVHERNSLIASVQVGDRQLRISCESGNVYATPETDQESEDGAREAARILLQGSSWRPAWRRIRRWMPLLPAAIAIVGMVWGVIAAGLHPAAVLTAAGAGYLLVSFAWQWSDRLRRVIHSASGPITFRAQSRQELYASRADRMANIKVALITAPISVAGALIIAWATGFISPKP